MVAADYLVNLSALCPRAAVPRLSHRLNLSHFDFHKQRNDQCNHKCPTKDVQALLIARSLFINIGIKHWPNDSGKRPCGEYKSVNGRHLFEAKEIAYICRNTCKASSIAG